MSKFEAIASSFGSTYGIVNGQHQVAVSKRRLLKFAANVGLQLVGVTKQKSQHTVALANYKALAMKCAVDFDGESLRLPVGYSRMDMSEKVNISFWTGMVFAAIVADDILGISCLVHAASFRRQGLLTVTEGSGRRLADFVGQDRAKKWHVIEAKARQRPASAKAQNAWKSQALTVSTVQGCKPATRSYVCTRVHSPYTVELVDPAESDTDRTNQMISFPGNAIIRGYYGALTDWLAVDDTSIRIRRGGADLRVKLAGYDTQEREFVFWGMTQSAAEAVARSEIPRSEVTTDISDTCIGSDGIVVTTSRDRALKLEMSD